MSTTTATTSTTTVCSPADRVTKSLLGYGVIAGPIYVAVSLAQALTRDGFDLSRHAWSLLANGEYGWIQIVNLVVTGLMVVGFAVGLRRALRTGPASQWAPRLIGVYGVSLVAAGAFRADPAAGFPVGTPVDVVAVSWHGLLHFAAGAIGFTCLAVACFRLAVRYRSERRPRFAAFSVVTGVAFLAGFAAMSATGGSQVGTLSFVVAVILVWTWMSCVAADRYREVASKAAHHTS